MTDKDHLFLCPGDAGVNQVALEHDGKRRDVRDNDLIILTSLRLMDADGVSQIQICELGGVDRDVAAVEADDDLILGGINAFDIADVAVENPDVPVVLRLDTLSPKRKILSPRVPWEQAASHRRI